MTFAVIVQARMTSTRLPGKVLEPLGEQSALVTCLSRCAQIPGIDHVVVAIPQGSAHDPVAAEVVKHDMTVVRGSENDVLARYCAAAKAVDADLVMRVTSDCPFIDPALCGDVVSLYHREQVDYACNNMPPRFPHGLDCEVFSAQRLYEAEWLARDPYDREHVTPFLRRELGYTRAALTGPGTGVERLRWTLDYPEDLACLQAIAAALGERTLTASWQEIAELCLRRPDITALNAAKIDEQRLSLVPQDDELVLTAPMPFTRVA